MRGEREDSREPAKIAGIIVVKSGEGPSVWLGGMGVVFKLSGAETRGAFAVVEHPIDPGRLVLPHVHTREVIAPAGFEHYFVELAEAGDPGRRQELAAKYGVTYSDEWVDELTSRYKLKLLGH